jgi:hypothetical protein
MDEPSVATYRASLREANLAQRELLARMRAAILAEQQGGRGMDWIENAIDSAGLWPSEGTDAQDLYNAEMAEQRRLREEWNLLVTP